MRRMALSSLLLLPLLLLLHSPAISLGFTIFGEIFAHVIGFVVVVVVVVVCFVVVVVVVLIQRLR